MAMTRGVVRTLRQRERTGGESPCAVRVKVALSLGKKGKLSRIRRIFCVKGARDAPFGAKSGGTAFFDALCFRGVFLFCLPMLFTIIRKEAI